MIWNVNGKGRTKRKLRDIISSLYDVADVECGYYYWFDKLLAYCLSMISYDGNILPSLPVREIEANLILTGHCVLFKNKNEHVTCQTELYGYDKYYNPTHAVYAQPKMLSRNLSLDDKNVAIIYNCNLENQVLGFDADGSLYSFIARYSRQLADIESTISLRLVDIRTPNMPAASNQNTRDSVQSFFDKITLGKRTVVSENPIIPMLSNIELNKQHVSDTVMDLLLARDKILEQFFREIGVRFYQTKKAQVNSDEVNANDSMFLISIDDMIKQRQKDFAYANEKLGINYQPKLNENWGGQYVNKDTN